MPTAVLCVHVVLFADTVKNMKSTTFSSLATQLKSYGQFSGARRKVIDEVNRREGESNSETTGMKLNVR